MASGPAAISLRSTLRAFPSPLPPRRPKVVSNSSSIGRRLEQRAGRTTIEGHDSRSHCWDSLLPADNWKSASQTADKWKSVGQTANKWKSVAGNWKSAVPTTDGKPHTAGIMTRLSRWSSEDEGGERESDGRFGKPHCVRNSQYISQSVEESGKATLLRVLRGGKEAPLYTLDISCTITFKGISDDAHDAFRSEAIRFFFDEIRLRCSAGLDVELFGNASMTWSLRVQFTPVTPLRHG